MKDYQLLQQQYTVNIYTNRQLTLVKGKGVFLFDEKGEKYLDCMSNYGVNILGYQHPQIIKALTDQLKRLTTLHGSFSNDVRSLASEALIEKCGKGYKQVNWSNSGTEAIEAALKFAVLATGKRRFIVCEHGYHGKTLGALSATAGEKYKQPFAPLLWEFIQVPFNDLAALRKAIDTNTAAFLFEPVQGEGGIYAADDGYLKKVREICDAKGILLCIDEIQTGCGRTGTFLASQKEKVVGDILCLGKGLAGGIPVGATVVSAKVGTAIPKHIHTSTFGGNPLAGAGVLATLAALDNKLMKHVQKMGIYFQKQIGTIQSDLILGFRGSGLMMGLVVKDKRNQIMKGMQSEKVLVIPAGENVVRLLPPLIIEKEQIDMMITALKKVLQELE